MTTGTSPEVCPVCFRSFAVGAEYDEHLKWHRLAVDLDGPVPKVASPTRPHENKRAVPAESARSRRADRIFAVAAFISGLLGTAAFLTLQPLVPTRRRASYLGLVPSVLVLVACYLGALRTFDLRPGPKLWRIALPAALMGTGASLYFFLTVEFPDTSFATYLTETLPGIHRHFPFLLIAWTVAMIVAPSMLSHEARKTPYCDSCARSMRLAFSQERSIRDDDPFRDAVEAVAADGFRASAIEWTFAEQNRMSAGSVQANYRTTISIWTCSGCRAQLVRYETSPEAKRRSGVFTEGGVNGQVQKLTSP